MDIEDNTAMIQSVEHSYIQTIGGLVGRVIRGIPKGTAAKSGENVKS